MLTVLNCKQCAHYTECKVPCVYVDYIANGNTNRKEPLISNIIEEDADIPATRDYLSYLNELADDRELKIEYAMKIKDHKLRAIAAMLLVNLTRYQISHVLSMSYRNLNRIINNNAQLKALKHVKSA